MGVREEGSTRSPDSDTEKNSGKSLFKTKTREKSLSESGLQTKIKVMKEKRQFLGFREGKGLKHSSKRL